MSPPSQQGRNAAGARNRARLLAAVAALGLAAPLPARAYDLPALNLGNTSFFDGALPETGPGLYGMQYLELYSADKLTDANGNRLALPRQSLDSVVPTTQGLFVADAKVLDLAHPGVTVLVPVVAAISVADGANGAALQAKDGLADITVGAFLAFDPVMEDGHPLLAQSIELDVLVPTGRYSRNVAINPGSNFVSLDPFYAATLWLTPQVTLSGRFHYLWNAPNDAPNVSFGPGARTVQAGQAFHANLAAHYRLDERWGVGLNGYVLQQFTDTRVNGDAAAGRRERVLAIGPGLTWDLSRDYSVFLNAYQEFAAENRPEGRKLVLHLNAHFQ